MTPDELMRRAWDEASVENDGTHHWATGRPVWKDLVVEHGAAAIRRALADQRATIVAFFQDALNSGDEYEPCRRASYFVENPGVVDEWAARTGFKPPA